MGCALKRKRSILLFSLKEEPLRSIFSNARQCCFICMLWKSQSKKSQFPQNSRKRGTGEVIGSVPLEVTFLFCAFVCAKISFTLVLVVFLFSVGLHISLTSLQNPCQVFFNRQLTIKGRMCENQKFLLITLLAGQWTAARWSLCIQSTAVQAPWVEIITSIN